MVHYAISVIDTGNNHVVSTIALPFQPAHLAVSPDATRLYVTDASEGPLFPCRTWRVMDTTTGHVLTSAIPASGLPEDLVVSPDGTKIYVLDIGGYLDTISTTTNDVVSTIVLDGYPNHMGLSPDGKELYVPTVGEVEVIDTTTDTLLPPSPSPA